MNRRELIKATILAPLAALVAPLLPSRVKEDQHPTVSVTGYDSTTKVATLQTQPGPYRWVGDQPMSKKEYEAWEIEAIKAMRAC